MEALKGHYVIKEEEKKQLHYTHLWGDLMKSFNALEYIKLTDSLKNYYIISGLQQNQASRGCDGKIHLSWNSSCLETGDQR